MNLMILSLNNLFRSSCHSKSRSSISMRCCKARTKVSIHTEELLGRLDGYEDIDFNDDEDNPSNKQNNWAGFSQKLLLTNINFNEENLKKF